MRQIQYNLDSEEYGFVLFPEKFNEECFNLDDEIYINFSDFKYLIDSINAMYPLSYDDSESDNISDHFDLSGTNVISVKDWSKIVDDLESKTYSDENLKKFIFEVCTWVKKYISIADEIIVMGTA